MQRLSQQVMSPHRKSIHYKPSLQAPPAQMAHLSSIFSVPPTSLLLRSHHHLMFTLMNYSQKHQMMIHNSRTTYTSHHWHNPLTTSKHTSSNRTPMSTPQFNVTTHPATSMQSVVKLTQAPRSLAPTSNPSYMTTNRTQHLFHVRCDSSAP